MKEYQNVLDTFSLDGYHMYSKMVSRTEWGNKTLAKIFLEKYWLPDDQMEKKWKERLEKIFINNQKGFPEMSFDNEMELLILEGGRLFDKEDFARLQRCMLSIGDKFFVVIENTFGGITKDPPLRFIFPTTITWEELCSGNFVSSVFLESVHKEFFVFGESEAWGKYSATDYEIPVDIIGFLPKNSKLFYDNFIDLVGEWQNIKNNIPLSYVKKCVVTSDGSYKISTNKSPES